MRRIVFWCALTDAWLRRSEGLEGSEQFRPGWGCGLKGTPQKRRLLEGVSESMSGLRTCFCFFLPTHVGGELQTSSSGWLGGCHFNARMIKERPNPEDVGVQFQKRHESKGHHIEVQVVHKQQTTLLTRIWVVRDCFVGKKNGIWGSSPPLPPQMSHCQRTSLCRLLTSLTPHFQVKDLRPRAWTSATARVCFYESPTIHQTQPLKLEKERGCTLTLVLKLEKIRGCTLTLVTWSRCPPLGLKPVTISCYCHVKRGTCCSLFTVMAPGDPVIDMLFEYNWALKALWLLVLTERRFMQALQES